MPAKRASKKSSKKKSTKKAAVVSKRNRFEWTDGDGIKIRFPKSK